MTEQNPSQTNQSPEQNQGSHSAQNGHGTASSKPALSGGKALVLILVLLVVAVILAVTGIVPRLRARTKLEDETKALAAPSVLVQKPVQGQPSQEIVLPGNMQAFSDSSIYARTNGYLKKWYFDIGAHVKEGQLLAVIESPEIDQQLAQAKADLATAQANAGNAKIQSARYQELLKNNAVSAQDTDNFTTQEASTNTQVQSAVANVQHYQELVGFEKVFAPFSGTITARDVDIGALITAGTSNEIFHLADEHILRVYVNVPQVYSQSLNPGTPVYLTLDEFPGQNFPAKLVRTSRAIDLASRTLLVEVDYNNAAGHLFPGAYAQVHFKVDASKPTLIIPVGALMFRSDGLRVGILQGNKAKLVPIVIGRDDGRQVEVTDGIKPDDQVIADPPDSLIDGEEVDITQPKQAGNQPAGKPGEGAGGGATGGASGAGQSGQPQTSPKDSGSQHPAGGNQ